METRLILPQELDVTRGALLAAVAGREEANLAQQTVREVTEMWMAREADAQRRTAVAMAKIENLTERLKAANGEVFVLELCSIGAAFLCSAVFLPMTFPMNFVAYMVLGSLATVGLIDVIARLVALTEGEAASRIGDETIGLCSLAAVGLCLVLPNYSYTYCYLATRGCVGIFYGRITWERVVAMVNSWADGVGVR